MTTDQVSVIDTSPFILFAPSLEITKNKEPNFSPRNPFLPSSPFHFLLALSIGAGVGHFGHWRFDRDVGHFGHWRFDLTPRPSQAVETRTTCV